MNRLLRLGVSLTLAASAIAVALLCCSDPTLIEYCTGIPDGGCPAGGASNSANCADPTCAAIYTATAATNCAWTLVEACPNYIAPHDAGHDASDAADAYVAPQRDASFVLPPGASGGPGCMDLEQPDCTVEEAVACSDCCGCQDLYVCVDGGWNLWGECSDAGTVQPVEQ